MGNLGGLVAVNNKRRVFQLFLGVIGLAVCSTIVVAELSGTEVMQRVQDQANYHHTKTSVVSMQIVNKKKKKRHRVFKSFSKYKPEIGRAHV